MTASLAYRRNETAILSGDIPEKYTRLISYVPGDNILEIGSAEGVLALLLAKQGKRVTALERSLERHADAQALRDAWGIEGPRFINGAIEDHLHLLGNIDTLVAVRVVYYFGAQLDRIFAEVAKRVPNVVLCGNGNRARRWRAGVADNDTRADNFYASREGMTDLLTRHGYRVVQEVTEGDEIVVGRKD